MANILRKSEEDPHICPKCKRELVKTGSMVSAGVAYQIYRCSHCGKEVLKLK